MTMPAARKYSTTTEADIVRHLAQGLTTAQTAAALNVSPRMLYHCISVLGIKSRGRADTRGKPKARKSRAKPLALPHNPFAITRT